MGSFLSSAADAAPADEFFVAGLLEADVLVNCTGSKEECDASYTSRFVDVALEHYNSNNPGAEFDLIEPLKAACVGFREDFWYHVGFLARPRDGPPDNDAYVQHFFAELRLIRHRSKYRRLIVETCIILEKPLCRYRSRCAFCPDKFETLHPSDGEFVCGKKGHRKKFFRARNILSMPFRQG